MNTIKQLEDRLQRELPAFHWQCTPTLIHSSPEAVPICDEIEVRATRSGQDLPGSPFRFSTDLLHRWGVDASARLICNEVTPQPALHRQALGWDKLAEF
ncbi:MAG: hypothetical protein AB1813_03675 [Verrucomicrobiota bacterium]|jgi:hypothetical protein